jgi:Holliday junction DNA helicase RuvA
MISRLSGILIDKDSAQIVLDVQGVGYAVDVPLTTYYQLPNTHELLTLWTHLSVREDAHQLFGFHEREQRNVFLLLIKVSGVGPKLALTILSGMDVSALRNCLQREDIATLTRIPGIGKKTAERLVIELRDKLDKFSILLPGERKAANVALLPEATASEEAMSALVALGYKPLEAQRAVNAVKSDSNLNSDDTATLVRAALKGLLKS